MALQGKVFYALFLALLMIISTVAVLQSPVDGDDTVEEPVEVRGSVRGPIQASSRTSYPGTTYTVGPTPAFDSTTIQGAVDMCSDGDRVSVSPGTYQEEVAVNNEIWIMGATGVKLVPLVAPITNNGFTLNAANVTISSFNITDFFVGVFSRDLGHNLTENEFYHNTRDLLIDVDETDLDTWYMVEDLIFSDNQVTRDGSGNSVDIEVNLDYDETTSSRVDLGHYHFLRNDFYSSAASGDFMEMEINFKEMNGGNLSIGDIVISGNTMRGHGMGIDINGDNIRYLNDVTVSLGRLMILNNRIIDHDDGGINVNYYDLEYMTGATTITMGEALISGNIVRTSGSSESIYINNYAYWRELHNSTSINAGNITFEDNTLDGGSYGIYLSHSYLGYEMTHQSSVSAGHIIVTNNDIVRSGYGIYITVEDAYYLHNSSSITIGKTTVTGNTVRSNYHGLYLYYYYLASYMDGSSSFRIGDILVEENEIQGSMSGTGYSGIGLYFDQICYDMNGQSYGEVPSVTLIDNDLWGYYGVNFDSFLSIANRMKDESTATIGAINISSNRIRGIDDAVLIDDFYEVGLELRDLANVSMDHVNIDNNKIWAGDFGIYVDRFEYMGAEMYNSSHFSLGDLSISKNVIISDDDGVYIDYLEYWGYNMEGDSGFRMGSIMINRNRIQSNSTGVYLYYIEDFGEELNDNASFVMKNIDVIGNTIHSNEDGIYTYYFEYFGYYLYNWSSFEMGDIRFNDNEIISDSDYGMYLEYFYYFGYEMEQRSTFSMGKIEICRNDILSDYDGMYMYYFEYFANYMEGESSFSMEEIMVCDNHVRTNGTGIYLYELYDMGYNLDQKAEANFAGFHMDGNDIDALEEGIVIYDINYLGEDLHDDSRYYFGNLTVNENKVRSDMDGIFINEYYKILSDMSGDARGNIGWLMVNHNIIDSGGPGITIQEVEYFGANSRGRSRGRADGIQIINNSIISDQTAILMDQGNYFGQEMDEFAEVTMGPWIISDNLVESASHAVYILQDNMGNAMTSGDPVMEGLFITDNVFDTGRGININFRTVTMTGMANITIEEIRIDNNRFVRTSGGDTIYLGVSAIVDDSSHFEIGRTVISNNEQVGSNVSVIHVHHTETETLDGEADLSVVEIFGNNITGGGEGLELEGTVNARVYVNNFIANIDDVSAGSAFVNWVSPNPMWYRFGMKNYSSVMGNYWDTYTGPDNNGDGIGDNPYNTAFGLDTKPLMRGIWELLPPWNDVTPPMVIIDSPANGSMIASENVTMAWTVEDDLLGVENIWVRLDGGAWIDVDMASQHSFTYLWEGDHTLSVRASDVAGNENITSVYITIDLTLPDVWFESPDNGDAFNTTSIDVVWNASDDLSGIVSYSISLNDGNASDMGSSTSTTLDDLTEGVHTIRVTAFDGAGLMGIATVEIIVDLTDPEITMVHPTDGSIVTADRVNATWTANGGSSGIGHFSISLDGSNMTDIGDSLNRMMSDLSNGEHTLDLICFDGAGNSVSESISFTVDTSAPAAVIMYPPDGSFLNRTSFDASWSLNGLVHPVQKVEYRLDSGSWVITENLGAALLDLDEGQHSLDVRITDISGNSDAATSIFTVDITKPTIISASHDSNDAVARGPIQIVLSEAVDTFNITLNDENVDVDHSGDTLTILVDELSPSTVYSLDITASDLAGNRMDTGITFTTAGTAEVSGRIVDENGDPVEGARVVFDSGEEVITDENGEFTVDVSHGTRTATVYDADGNEIGSFDFGVTAGEPMELDDQEVKPQGKEKGFPWWILAIIALVILIIVGILVFALRSKGMEAEEEEFEDADDLWEDDEDLDDEFDDDEWEDDEEFDEDEWDEDEF